jgi:diguanylate cyclase (GGDEF)-like protein/PAS domain S-box-containing protein
MRVDKSRTTSQAGDAMIHVNSQLEAIRSRLTDNILMILAIFAPITTAASVSRFTIIGFLPVMMLQIILSTYLCALYYFRNKLSAMTKALSMSLVLIMVGLGSVLQFGILSPAYTFFNTGVCIAAIMIGMRTGLILLSFVVLSLFGAGISMYAFGTAPSFDVAAYLIAPQTWLTVALAVAMCVGLMLYAIQTYNRSIVEALDLAINTETILLKRTSELEEMQVDRDLVFADLQSSEEFKTVILNSVQSEIAVLDGHGIIVSVNEAWRKFALENTCEGEQPLPNAGIGASYLGICRAGDGSEKEGALEAHNGIMAVLSGSLPIFSMEYPCHSNTEQRWFAMTVAPLWHRKIRGVVITHTNITNLRQAISDREQAFSDIQISEARLRTIFDASPDALLISDAQGAITMANSRVEEVLGYMAEDLIGQSIEALVPKSVNSAHSEHRSAYIEAPDRRLMLGGRTIKALRKDGSECEVEINLSRVDTDQGVMIASALRDISERRRAEGKIAELSFFDHLTGLPNRTLLMDRMKLAMTASYRDGKHCALLFIDLDNFKALNETLGHEIGDQLLRDIAPRLVASVREDDTVARLGGDEFLVLLVDLARTESEAANQVEAIGLKIIEALSQPYSLNNQHYVCTPSIGATLFFGHVVADDLLKQSDLAMYKAKAEGGASIHFFDPKMEEAVIKRAKIEADLRQGLIKKQFLLHYQPQIFSNGRMTGVEALVRWRHPVRGLVPPSDFIPLAEETGLILQLGNWVLEAACKQLAEWATRPELADLTVAVNVSVQQFHQPEFVDHIQEVIRVTGANPERLKLELTESMLAENVQDIIKKMFALKADGIGFSLDDFGTGYSSLSYLKQLPLDQLKIDQSFVRDVLTDPSDATIAKTIVNLAQSLGLSVIAEGVETEAQRNFLETSGCHSCQGYFFSRPLPIEEFEEYARRCWS